MIGRALARQGSRPAGPIAPIVGRFLNRETRATNSLARRALDPQPGDDILEIGFGGGRTLGKLLEIARSHVAGLELSEAMVSAARRTYAEQIEAGRLELAAGDIGELPFGDDRFDRVLTVNTIYFWSDPPKAIAEVMRVMRPGGRLAIGTNSREHMESRWFFKHGYHRLYADEEIRALLESAGFTAVRTSEEGHAVATAAEKPGASA